jgi:chromosome segregation ATPase
MGAKTSSEHDHRRSGNEISADLRAIADSSNRFAFGRQDNRQLLLVAASRLDEVTAELTELQEQKAAIDGALVSATALARDIEREASERATRLVEEAQAEAAATLAAAESHDEAMRIVQEAEAEAAATLVESRKEATRIEQEARANAAESAATLAEAREEAARITRKAQARAATTVAESQENAKRIAQDARAEAEALLAEAEDRRARIDQEIGEIREIGERMRSQLSESLAAALGRLHEAFDSPPERVAVSSLNDDTPSPAQLVGELVDVASDASARNDDGGNDPARLRYDEPPRNDRTAL